MSDAQTPRAIEQAGPDELRIVWADGHECRYPVRLLRLACLCAHCIEENTGRALLDPAKVPDGVRPLRVQSVGRYAIQFYWSDGHDTGIYTFDHLREMCPDD